MMVEVTNQDLLEVWSENHPARDLPSVLAGRVGLNGIFRTVKRKVGRTLKAVYSEHGEGVLSTAETRKQSNINCCTDCSSGACNCKPATPEDGLWLD